jgi:hypothetical protein
MERPDLLSRGSWSSPYRRRSAHPTRTTVEVLSKLLFLLRRSILMPAIRKKENGCQVAEISTAFSSESDLIKQRETHRPPYRRKAPRRDTILWDSEVPGFGIRMRRAAPKAGSSNSVIAPKGAS